MSSDRKLEETVEIDDGGLSLPTATSLSDLSPATKTALEIVCHPSPSIASLTSLASVITDPTCNVNRLLGESLHNQEHDQTLLTISLLTLNDCATYVLVDCERVKCEVEANDGWSPAALAARAGAEIALSTLFHDRGVSLSPVCRAGCSPLHAALRCESDLVAMWLLRSAGVDPSVKDHKGRTALHLAVREQHLEAAGFITACCPDCDIHAKAKDGSTPFSLATNGRLKAFFALLDDPALRSLVSSLRPSSSSSSSLTPTPTPAPPSNTYLDPSIIHSDLFSKAASFQQRCLVLLWLKLCLNPDVSAVLGSSHPTRSLPSESDHALLRDHSSPLLTRILLLRDVALLHGGALLPEAESLEELHPSTAAAWNMLLGKSPSDSFDDIINSDTCEVNRLFALPDQAGSRSLLTHAVQLRRDSLIGSLVNCPQVDLDLSDSSGMSPACFAALADDLEILKLLHSRGADLRSVRPLRLALGQPKMQRWMLEKGGVDPHAVEANGSHPLMTAVEGGDCYAVALLTVTYGANIRRPTKHGSNPLDHAILPDIKAFFALWDDSDVKQLISSWTSPEEPPSPLLPRNSSHAALFSAESAFETRCQVLQLLKASTNSSVQTIVKALAEDPDSAMLPTVCCSPGADLTDLTHPTSSIATRLSILTPLTLFRRGILLPPATSLIDMTPATRSAWELILNPRNPTTDATALSSIISDPSCELNRLYDTHGKARSLLLQALRGNLSHLAVLLIECAEVDCDVLDSRRMAPGIAAAAANDVPSLKALQCRDVDLNALSFNDLSPLTAALTVESCDAACWLLTDGMADPHGPGLFDDVRPLMLCAKSGVLLPVALLLLVEKGVNVVEYSDSALVECMIQNNWDMFCAILQLRGLLRVLSWSAMTGYSALELAERRGMVDFREKLEEAMEVAEVWERRVVGVTIGLAAADKRVSRKRM